MLDCMKRQLTECRIRDNKKFLLTRGNTQGLTLQQRTNITLTTSPFSNTYEEHEVSLEVEGGVVARLRCLQP
jgi:hypothetical protein